jgi:trans-2,3-dihydro-3-hydroxyanthranilate isomerase
MSYQYYICDVFTDSKYGGNQLAVIPDASGLSSEQMQQIAREFNFSESTFVFPAQHGNSYQVRIFTPSREVPFAGHPNIGTAFVLNDIGMLDDTQPVVFEEKAGLVKLELHANDSGARRFSLAAPEAFSFGQKFSAELLAQALSLENSDIKVDVHLPVIASSGLPFILVELSSLKALQNAKVNLPGFEALAALGVMPDIHLYTISDDEYDVRCRMFAPFDGVNEDPATGSANCALAGLLAHYHCPDDGKYQWKVAQGVEMGRPSKIQAFSHKHQGKVVSTGVAGGAVMFAKGTLL